MHADRQDFSKPADSPSSSPSRTPTVIPTTTRLEASSASLSRLTYPAKSNLLSVKPYQELLKDFRTNGLKVSALVKETIKGVVSSTCEWAASFAVLSLGIQALTDKSTELAMCSVAAWVGLKLIKSTLDHSWDKNIGEMTRTFSRATYARVLSSLDKTSFRELDDAKFQANLQLQYSHADEVAQSLNKACELPSFVTQLGLSASLLALTDWKVLLTVAVASLPTFILHFRHSKEDLKLESRQSKKAKVEDAILDEAYSPDGTIKMVLGGMTKKVVEIADRLQQKLDKQTNLHELRQARETRLGDVVYFTALGLGIYSLFAQSAAGAINVGVVGFLTLKLLEFGAEMTEHAGTSQEYFDMHQRIKTFYGMMPSEAKIKRSESFPKVPSIEFKSASFIRGSETDLFRVALPDFKLKQGDLLLLRGSSGAGKSTILRHLAFACEPDNGAFTISGVNSHELNFDEWRSNIAYCPPNSSLFNGFTIRQVLTMGIDGDKHLEEKLKHPLIKELVDSLGKRALSTRIGIGIEGARDFSTGELRRLALVNSFIPRPKILFLDEVTVNLNKSYVNIIADEISRARAAGTIILFATHSDRFDESASHIVNIAKSTFH